MDAMPGKWKKPVWGALVLAAALASLYLLLPLRRFSVPDLELLGRPKKYSSGDDLPTSVAAYLPEKSFVNYSPKESPIKVPRKRKQTPQAKDYPDLTDRQRSKLIKRGKRPQEKELKYRFRLEKGWEYYEIPRALHDFYTDTWQAMNLAREATGETTMAPSGKEGFQITSIDEGSLLGEVGIQPGDVIISVNGEPMRGPRDGRRVYAQLKHESTFWVVIERKGETINLYYRVE